MQKDYERHYEKIFQDKIQEVSQASRQVILQAIYTEEFLPIERFLNKDSLIEDRVSLHFGLFSDSYNSGQIPFTDNPTAQAAFMKTFQANVEKKENADILHEVLRNYKVGYLVKDIMKNHIAPLPGIEAKSHEDILELKERLKDDLEAFKVEMRKLVHDIKSNPWDESFEADMIRVIDTKINPTIHELNEKKKKDAKLSKYLKLGGPSAGILLAVQAIPNIPTKLALGIISLGIGAPIMGEWLEARVKKQSEYNGLNLLIELKEELG